MPKEDSDVAIVDLDIDELKTIVLPSHKCKLVHKAPHARSKKQTVYVREIIVRFCGLLNYYNLSFSILLSTFIPNRLPNCLSFSNKLGIHKTLGTLNPISFFD